MIYEKDADQVTPTPAAPVIGCWLGAVLDASMSRMTMSPFHGLEE